MTNYFKKCLSKSILVFAIVICGVLGISNSAYADTLEKWTKQPNIPKPLCFSSSVALDGKIYVMGGIEKVSGSDFSCSSSVYTYDPSTGDCVKKADMPEPIQEHESVVIDGKIYVFGGMGKNSREQTSSVYVYDPSLNTWSKKTDMPKNITREFSLVMIDGNVYLISGLYMENNTLKRSYAIYMYSPTSNTWTKKTDMPSNLLSNPSVAVNGKIYIIGEYSDGTSYSSITIYDPITNTFSKKNSGLPNFNPSNGAVVFHNKIYFFGGFQDNRDITTYDINTDTFIQNSKIPTTISQSSFNYIVLNDKIYLLGGILSDSSYVNSVDAYEESDSEANTKLTLEDGPIILEVGQTHKVTSTITPESSENKKVIWSISNPSVATIDQNGVLTGVSEGSTVITATSEDGELSDNCKVEVKPASEVPTSKNRVILRVALTNGSINEYDLSMAEVQNFINWYNGRAEGKGKISFAINKNANIKPFKTRTDYLVFDKIYSFEVNEYELNNNEK